MQSNKQFRKENNPALVDAARNYSKLARRTREKGLHPKTNPKVRQSADLLLQAAITYQQKRIERDPENSVSANNQATPTAVTNVGAVIFAAILYAERHLEGANSTAQARLLLKTAENLNPYDVYGNKKKKTKPAPSK